MQEDFHYYATYCAAFIAGYSHKESLDICYAAQMVDCLSATFLKKIKAPVTAATTQTQIELANSSIDLLGLQNITRIWSSFHFLPYDLYVKIPRRPKYYMNKYRLICKPCGDLVAKTVELAKGKALTSVGLSMHVLADTWAHSYFAGTPSRVINNTNYYFYEIIEEDGKTVEKKVSFKHNPIVHDDVIEGAYSGSVAQENEHSIMNLGHGRAGHFPDYSFVKYKYLPAWGDYEEIIKDNPSDYFKAFAQMVYALRYLRGVEAEFIKDKFAIDEIKPFEDEINEIIRKRQVNASLDWRAFGERLSGEIIPDFDMTTYEDEYINATKNEKGATYLGSFITAAMTQKSMVTHEIFTSGNMLAGFSVENSKSGGGRHE